MNRFTVLWDRDVEADFTKVSTAGNHRLFHSINRRSDGASFGSCNPFWDALVVCCLASAKTKSLSPLGFVNDRVR